MNAVLTLVYLIVLMAGVALTVWSASKLAQFDQPASRH
jgi:hypothetical protein